MEKIKIDFDPASISSWLKPENSYPYPSGKTAAAVSRSAYNSLTAAVSFCGVAVKFGGTV